MFGELIKNANVSLGTFYARRFLRTLPSYYFILAFYILIPPLAAQRSPNFWEYVFFLQNLSRVEIFGVSWSLCVEEHFYLFFPLLILLFVRLNDPKAVVVTVIAILVMGIFLRSLLWYSLRPDHYFTQTPQEAGIYTSAGFQARRIADLMVSL